MFLDADEKTLADQLNAGGKLIGGAQIKQIAQQNADGSLTIMPVVALGDLAEPFAFIEQKVGDTVRKLPLVCMAEMRVGLIDAIAEKVAEKVLAKLREG